MSAATFVRANVAGLIATFVMTLGGFWIDGLGLPQVDVGAMITASTLAHLLYGLALELSYGVAERGARVPAAPARPDSALHA